MSGIFGLFNRNGRPVDPQTLETMRQAMAYWGPDGSGVWIEGEIGLGQLMLFNTPEAPNERLPRRIGEPGLALTAEARIDNREDLFRKLDIPPEEQSGMPDGDLILRAYLKWGEDCPDRLLGDWSFAVWDPTENRLFLARDPFGNTALYYYIDDRIFAFASCLKALFALDLAPSEIDDLYVAQILVVWPAYHGERTAYKHIRRLPPAHALTVTPDTFWNRRYWFLENISELNLPSREEYAEAFLEIYDEATRCRLRSHAPVGVTLSGGLDSGSVASLAARSLGREGKRLPAFASVPVFDTEAYTGSTRFGDETPHVLTTARFAGNIDVTFVNAEAVSPLDGVRHWLDIHDEPKHGAGNSYWTMEIFRSAKEQGIGTMLTGQEGNLTVSWEGAPRFHPLAVQMRLLGLRETVMNLIARNLPRRLNILQRDFLRNLRPWSEYSAVSPALVQKLRLKDLMRLDEGLTGFRPPRNPLEMRIKLLLPDNSVGTVYAESGAAWNMEIRDPTGDIRVLSYCLSVPDPVYLDPKRRQRRCLIRQAMTGILPDEVRLNQIRGRQSADLVMRLKASAHEVEDCLNRLHGSLRAREYIDLNLLRQVWNEVRFKASPDIHRKAALILMRGMMAGLFIMRHDK